MSDLDAVVGDGTDKQSGDDVSSKSMQSPDTEETSKVHFCAASITSELETQEVQVGVAHSRFANGGVKDDSNVGCGVSCGAVVCVYLVPLYFPLAARQTGRACLS